MLPPPPRRSSLTAPATFPTALLLIATLTATIAAPPPFACDTQSQSYKFCDKGLGYRERAKDLVSRLSLDEKAMQLVNTAPAIPRLGVPAYEWWSEALHGVADTGKGIIMSPTTRINAVTSFPQVILSAASFDANLWYRIGQAIGKEARGVYNVGQAKGMTFWAPNINIFRDPRWGRGQETPGEDPLVNGKYAVSFVRGFQGDTFDGKRSVSTLQASACCKHFTAYDLDRWNNVTRYVFDAQVSAQDMADSYQPPFESCIHQARASGIMCAYNRVNGVPNCADYNLLTKTARGQWAFDGYIASDCDAVSIIHDAQGYAKTPEDAVADVLKAGMDVNCGDYLQKYTKSSVQQGKVAEADVDRALENLFAIRIRLGLFDGNPSKLVYGDIGPNQVCSIEHKYLALKAAQGGIVLLKNDAKLLPLPKTKDLSLAVIGPNADSFDALLGNYHGPPCSKLSPLRALQIYTRNTRYNSGCNNVACSSASIQDAVNIAKEADYVVMIMGLDLTQEKEDLDRSALVLPGQQQNLITEVAKAAKQPVVLVLLCGGPVDVSFAKMDPRVGSIIWAGYPGESGGVALAQIIFGDHNPGGKLPMTWYPNDYIKVPMTDMRMRADPSSGYPGRTYKFYKGPTVFDFGYGLSYSTVKYELTSVSKRDLHLHALGTVREMSNKFDSISNKRRRFVVVSDKESEACKVTKVMINVTVSNVGEMKGRHPVLLFARQDNQREGSPIKKLVGFESVELGAGESKQVEFELRPCEYLTTANEDGDIVVEEGKHLLSVGENHFPFNIHLG